MQTWRWTLLNRKAPRINFANKLEVAASKIFPPYEAWDTYAACYLISRNFATAIEYKTILVEYTGVRARGVVLVDKYNLVYKNKNVRIVTRLDMNVYEYTFERVLT